MGIAPKISKKAKIKAGIKYLRNRWHFGVVIPSKAKWNAWQYKLVGLGPDYYDAEKVVEQARDREKRYLKGKKQGIRLITKDIKRMTMENMKALADLKARAKIAPKQVPPEKIAKLNELDKETRAILKGVGEVKHELTLHDLSVSDKETRKRFFRMKKFKKTKQRH